MCDSDLVDFFSKQKTADEMRISDGSSGVGASHLLDGAGVLVRNTGDALGNVVDGGLDLLGNVAEPVIGFTGNVGRDALENVGEFNLNQFGHLAQRGTDLFNDVRGNAGEAIDGITDAERDEFAKGGVVGGNFDEVGSLPDGSIRS